MDHVVRVKLQDRAITQLRDAHDWIAENCQSYAGLWVGEGDKSGLGRDVLQHNGLFEMGGDEVVTEVINAMIRKSVRNGVLLSAHFDDPKEAMLFKLVFGGN